MAINFLVILRILIGLVFIVSGFEKLISPYQNFLYVVQGYQLFGAFLENIIVQVMPWVEFLLGVFLLLGIWMKWALRAMLIITAGFIIIVGQALVRNLPITECGCFGEMVSIPLYVIILFDSWMLFVINFLMRKEERANMFSLDRYFAD